MRIFHYLGISLVKLSSSLKWVLIIYAYAIWKGLLPSSGWQVLVVWGGSTRSIPSRDMVSWLLLLPAGGGDAGRSEEP